MTKLKRKSAIIVTAIALFAAALLALPGEKLWNDEWGGSVSAAEITPSEPSKVDGVYQIGTAAELYWFAGRVNGTLSDSTGVDYAANAVLTADIVVNANASAYGSTIWYPIENYGGIFDGQGHTISGLNIDCNSEGYCGLFARVGFTDEYYQFHSSTVKNLGVINSFIKQASGKLGMICGENNGTILNCYSTGTIGNNGNIGGICGENSEKGKIINCYSTVSVDGGSSTTGGICGVNSLEPQDNIENCYSTDSTVVGNNCYSPNNVKSKSRENFSRGEVAFLLSQGKDGEIWGQNEIVTDITKEAYPVLNGKKVYNYCNGEDKYTIVESERHDYTVTADDGSKKCTCGAIGLVEAEQDADGVYQISNASELFWFSDRVKNDNENFRSSKAVLTADITVNENVLDENGNLNSDKTFIEWMPIGTPLVDRDIILSFSGTFDGQNHVISGLYYSTDTPSTVYRYAGLFSTVRGGTVMNVGVVDSYFHATYTRSGGITGCVINGGTIKNCYSNCHVESNGAGGIAGEVTASNIINCYSLGNVKGLSDLFDGLYGGICGLNANNSAIINCYSSANVEGSGTSIGGIAGYNTEDSTIKNCYYNTDVYYREAIGRNSGTVKDVSGMKEIYFISDNEPFISGICGKVTYLLSHGEEDGSVWGQDLSTKGEFPSFCDKKVISNSNVTAFSNKCLLYGENVALDGNIKLNVYIAAVPDFTNWQLKITLGNTDGTTFKAEEAEKIENNLYKFSFVVAPKDIPNTFYIELTCLDNPDNPMSSSGGPVVSNYLEQIINKPEFESQRSIAQALLDYGKAAKAYFDKNGTVEPVESVTADDLRDYSMNFNSANMPEGVEYVGSTLLLEHATTLRHYFKFSDSVTPGGFKINDKSVEPKQFEGDSSIYYIDTDPIIANELSQNYTVSINGNVIMSNCSVLTYAKSVLNDKDSSENLKNLVKTIYNYHQAATAYSKSLNENL